MKNNSGFIGRSLNQEWTPTFSIKLYSDNLMTYSYMLSISYGGVNSYWKIK